MIKFVISEDKSDLDNKMKNEILDFFTEKNIEVNVNIYPLEKQILNYIKAKDYVENYNNKNININTIKDYMANKEKDYFFVFITTFEDIILIYTENYDFKFINKSDFPNMLYSYLDQLYISYIQKNKKYRFTTSNGIVYVKSNDICCFNHKSKSTYLYCHSKEYRLTNLTLQKIYKEFSRLNFVYIDRSTIVNLQKAISIKDNLITIDNNLVYPIANSRLKYVKEQFLINKIPI